MKTIAIVYILLIVAVIVLAFLNRNHFSFAKKTTNNTATTTSSTSSTTANASQPTPSVTITTGRFLFFTTGSKTYHLIVARTDAEKQLGLSGRTSLDKDTGMLFPFDRKDYYPFWMIQMRFPIDIIYIDDNKVVDIIPNAPIPQTNNPADLPIYKPKAPANYVLEINANQAKDNNIKGGDSVSFSNIK